MKKQKIVHITIGTPVGGTTSLLRDIIANDITHNHVILSLDKKNEISIPNATIHIYPVKSKNPIVTFFKLLTAIFWLPIMVAKLNPKSVLAWTIPSCCLSLLVRLVCKNYFWTLHGTFPNISLVSRASVIGSRVLSPLSFLPKKIIFCGHNVAKTYENMGYRKNKSHVIINGINTEKFQPNKNMRIQFRKKYDIKGDKIIIGWIATPYPQKDPELFIKAMEIICQHNPHILPIMAGPDIGDGNRILDGLIEKYNMTNTIITLPNQQDPRYFYNGIDVLSLTSVDGEGDTPLTLQEASSCRTLYTTTQVGDWQSVKLQEFVSPVSDCDALVAVFQRAIRHIKTKNPERQSQPKTSLEMTTEYIDILGQ